MECMNCNGTGYIYKEDKIHDVMVRVKCIDCMLEEKIKEELLSKMQILLASVSPQMLARYASIAIIHAAYQKDSADALEQQIQSKNKIGLLTWISTLD
tara:strand:+ start:945 stop:1238 length:294 start_codon:yes stop_codon:yes gene_type:complete